MSNYDAEQSREYERARSRMNRAGIKGSVVAAINSGTVPSAPGIRRAMVDGLSPANLPEDQAMIIDQLNRRHIGIGNGLVDLVEKLLLSPEHMERILETMTLKDAMGMLDMGVKLQRTGMAAMGNRSPGETDQGHRRALAGKVLKDISMLDKLHEICVDDEVDPDDMRAGLVVDVRQKQEMIDAEEDARNLFIAEREANEKAWSEVAEEELRGSRGEVGIEQVEQVKEIRQVQEIKIDVGVNKRNEDRGKVIDQSTTTGTDRPAPIAIIRKVKKEQ